MATQSKVKALSSAPRPALYCNIKEGIREASACLREVENIKVKYLEHRLHVIFHVIVVNYVI
jgi:hypothetical protein